MGRAGTTHSCILQKWGVKCEVMYMAFWALGRLCGLHPGGCMGWVGSVDEGSKCLGWAEGLQVEQEQPCEPTAAPVAWHWIQLHAPDTRQWCWGWEVNCCWPEVSSPACEGFTSPLSASPTPGRCHPVGQCVIVWGAWSPCVGEGWWPGQAPLRWWGWVAQGSGGWAPWGTQLPATVCWSRGHTSPCRPWLGLALLWAGLSAGTWMQREQGLMFPLPPGV